MFLLNEEITRNDLKGYIKELYDYCRGELKKIDRDAKIFLKEDKKNADDIFGKTAFYNPTKEEIYLFLTDRHPKDVLRSLAHEMVHHEQNCRGDTDKLDMSVTSQDPSYALHNEGLREMEREAFERGSMIFRDWCDKHKMLRKKEKIMEGKIKVRVKEEKGKSHKEMQEAHGDPEELNFDEPEQKSSGGMLRFAKDPSADDSHGDEETGEEEIEVSTEENAQSLVSAIKSALADGDKEEAKEMAEKLVKLLQSNPHIKLHHKGKPVDVSKVKVKEGGTYDGPSSLGGSGGEIKGDLEEAKKMKCESCGKVYKEGKKHSCEEGKMHMNESKKVKKQESQVNPHPELFQQKERLFKERFNNHEEIIFQEMLKRAIKEQK